MLESETADPGSAQRGQVASDTQLVSLFSSQRFSDALLSCSVREGGYRFVDQDQCVWLRTGGSGMDRSASSANRPFEQRAWQFAGGGQIEVFVEANGFAANLSLRTNGTKQTVQISSKGEIRGVNITMTKS